MTLYFKEGSNDRHNRVRLPEQRYKYKRFKNTTRFQDFRLIDSRRILFYINVFFFPLFYIMYTFYIFQYFELWVDPRI